jgi:hypothetical protein
MLLGFTYGFIFLHYYKGDDTWALNYESIEEHQKLLSDPWRFIKELDPRQHWGDYSFQMNMLYYLSKLEHWLITKPLGLFNIISSGNYYVNMVLFNSIVFWGHYWLFCALLKEFPAKRKVLLITIFFIPSIVFWLSGIRSEGMLLFFMGMLLLQFYKWIYHRKKAALALSIFALLWIVIIRNTLAILFIPALISWWLSIRFSKKPLPVFIYVYSVSAVIFFGSMLVFPRSNLGSLVVDRQKEFLQLRGNTRFALDTLQANPTSFIKVLPQAVQNTFLRPYPWEWKGLLQLISALEILGFWALAVFFVFRKDPEWKNYSRHPLLLCLLFFGLSLYVFVGYSVPFPGAIIRYKIPGELFLIIVISICIKWEFFKSRKLIF